MVRLTPLEAEDGRALARAFGVGEPTAFRFIEAGTINSNYSLTTGNDRFFLRVNEGKTEKDVRYEAELVRALAEAGVNTPAPLLTQNGEPFARYCGRCVSLWAWVDG